MEALIYILVFFTVVFFFYFIFTGLGKNQTLVEERLENLKEMDHISEDEDRMALPFSERIIKPFYQNILRGLESITPKSIIRNLDRVIKYSGSPDNMTPVRLIGIQIMVAFIMGMVGVAISQGLLGGVNYLLVLGLGLLGLYIPRIYISSKAKNRQVKIQRFLPDMLDLIYVSVEAGLGFDMAVKRTCEKMEGPLAEEMQRGLDEINRGRDRESALRGIVARTGVDDLSSFITAVIQSEQLGSNIANMLRVQSTTMRGKRRQRAEEQAMKIPIKMLFPLIFFMFPPLLIVILGPAGITLLNSLGDLF